MANEIITDAGIITASPTINTIVIGDVTYTGVAYADFDEALREKNIVAAQDCVFSCGTGYLVENNGGVVIDGCVFSCNTSDTFGGALCNTNPACEIQISGSTFSGNYAEIGGGALALDGGTVTIADCLFVGNTSGGAGGIFSGAIVQESGNLTLRNSRFATASDSVVCSSSNGEIVVGGTLTFASSFYSKKAVTVENDTHFVLDLTNAADSAQFLQNYAEALQESQAKFSITVVVSPDMPRETRYILAAGVYNNFGEKPITVSCGTDSAEITTGGYADFGNLRYELRQDYSELVLFVDSIPVDATIVTPGGTATDIHVGNTRYAGNAYVTEELADAFDENTVIAMKGGTVSGIDADIRVSVEKSFAAENIVYSGNSSVIVNAGTTMIFDSTFSGNATEGNGGAIYNSGTATISGSTFSGNMSEAGGAIYNYGTLTISDSIFSGNMSEASGAIYNFGALAISNGIFATKSDTLYNGAANLTFGGTITTAAEIYSDIAITIEPETKIVLDLNRYSGRELAAGLLRNYDTVFAPQQENLTISVNVGAAQQSGNYTLASGIGANGFTQTDVRITVAGDPHFGCNVTIGSSATRYLDKDYSLAIENDALSLSISDVPDFDTAVFVNNEWHGLANGTEVEISGGSSAVIGFNAFDNLAEAKASNPEKIKFAGGICGSVVLGGGESGEVADIKAKTELTFLAGTFSKSVFAGNKIQTVEMLQTLSLESSLQIQGGNYAAYVMGGDYLTTTQPNAAMVFTTGSRGMNISGGEFNGLVAGGSFIAGGTTTLLSQFNGNIDVTIAGGTFHNRVYGGDITDKKENSRTDIINGDISFTLDATQNSIHIGENIVCGSYGEGTTKGDVVFTVKGTADNLTFANTSVVNGGSGNGYLKVNTGKTVKEYENYVNGTSTAVFDGFSGEFTARLTLFDAISFSKGADVSLTNPKCNLAELSAWSFAGRASVAFYDGQVNDFTGDTLDIDLTDWDQTTPWTLATGSSEDVFHGFSSFSSVKFNGVNVDWDYDNSRWLSDSGDFALSLSESGGKKSMVLAQVC